MFKKDVDEASNEEIKNVLVQEDKSQPLADSRRCEPKKFGFCQIPEILLHNV